MIDDAQTRTFFEDRAGKKLFHRYNMVNFQDSQPELALERDRIEKEKIGRYIRFGENDRVLDIGCGVGRWGDAVVPLLGDGGRYVGVDYSGRLLAVARAHFGDDGRAAFVEGTFQDIRKALADGGMDAPFDGILINGVFMYINDSDVRRCLAAADALLAEGGFLYIRESVGMKERLTLDRFHSGELGADYSAIYRSLGEYTGLLADAYLSDGYILLGCGPTWSEAYDPDAQTDNWYWVMRKAGQRKGQD